MLGRKESFPASLLLAVAPLSLFEEAKGYKSRLVSLFTKLPLRGARNDLVRPRIRTIAKKLETTAGTLHSGGRKIARLREGEL